MRLSRLACLAALTFAACGDAEVTDSPTTTALSTLDVELSGQQLTLELRRSTPRVSPDFQRYRAMNGTLVQMGGLETLDLSCYFDARVVGTDSEFIVKTCAGSTADLRGVGLMNGKIYELRGNAMTLASAQGGTCATDGEYEIVRPSDPSLDASDVVTTRQGLSTGTPRLVELAVFEDSGMYEGRQNGDDLPDPVLAVHASAFFYDQTQFDDRILPLLTLLVDTQGQNPWGNPSNFGFGIYVGGYLNDFDNWLDGPAGLPDFDQATLLTGYDMQGSTVGLATVGGACDLGRNGAVVHANRSLVNVSQTIGHELGHSLGMVHDGSQGNNNCDPSAFVMRAQITNGPLPVEFSSCSITQGNQFLGSADAACITPLAAPAAPEPMCGDGKVDIGEACDCGPLGCEGRDACCDETTCQLKAGATCAGSDACCDTDTCQPFAPGAVVCRESASSCDVPEMCDGSAACPADVVTPTGTTCTDASGWEGACYVGECVTRGGTCEEIAPLYRFDDPPYAPVCGEDGGCGLLDCLADGYCVLTEHYPKDGTPCADGSQCFEGQCSLSTTLPAADGCAEPWRDSDSDGTRDCDDGCPFDAQFTVAPCDDPMNPSDPSDPNDPNDPTDPGNPGMGGPSTSTNGGSSGGDNPSDAADDVVVTTEANEGGCATTDARPTSVGLLGVLFFATRLRRRG